MREWHQRKLLSLVNSLLVGTKFHDNTTKNFVSQLEVASRLRITAGCSSPLLAELVLLPPLLCILDAKSMLEDLPDLFERHLRSLREAEEDEDPSESTKTGVETESPRRRHVLHHGEERGRDHNVGTPVEDVDHHRSHRADFHREEFVGLPWDAAETCSVEGYEQDHSHEDEVCGPTHHVGGQFQRLVVDWYPDESDGCHDEADWHSPHRPQKKSTTSNSVDDEDAQDGEDPVDHGDYAADCNGVRESDDVEKGGGVIWSCGQFELFYTSHFESK